MKTTLKLWVSNQPEGAGYDCTGHYIDAARWTAPAGVTLDAQMLTGEDETLWAAYRSLAAAVAEAGHGDDNDGEIIPGVPVLTACPTMLIEDRWATAGESLARHESPTCETWGEFVAAIPSLAGELAAAD